MRALKDAPRDMLFQFTRPRGARRHRIPQRYQVDSFNSRAREGRDDGLAA